jgi:hypothetical protein
MKQINNRHLSTHSLTGTQYKEMFPGAKLQILSEKQIENMKKNLKPRDSDILREETIKRNKSKEMRSKVSNALKGKSKSEEHKKALKEAKAKENKEKRAKINSKNRKGKPQPEGTVYKTYTMGKFFKSGIKEDLGHYVRCGWEANVARILKHFSIEYSFEQKSFLLNKPEGGQTRYTPDFYLPQYDTYIEVKGRWYSDGKSKFQLCKEQYPNIKIKLVDGKKYKRLEKRYKRKINNWE